MPESDRFVGEICGFGTASGVRVVIGRWERSPLGAFADAMVERADGHRVLIAPQSAVAEYVTAIYQFDEVLETAIAVERSPDSLTFRGGLLEARVAIGRRSPLGWVLRSIPRTLSTSRLWPVLTDPVARLAMPGVRTRGMTAGGQESYTATDLHRVDAVEASCDGKDLGALAPLQPPVRFGFSSAPRRPAIVAVTTTVRPTPGGHQGASR